MGTSPSELTQIVVKRELKYIGPCSCGGVAFYSDVEFIDLSNLGAEDRKAIRERVEEGFTFRALDDLEGIIHEAGIFRECERCGAEDFQPSKGGP